MTDIRTLLHGIYPRSADLAQATRDFDRKRTTLAQVEKLRKQDFKNLLTLQKETEVAFLEDGKLAWQDLFRPIVEATEGMEAGTLTRWFDNNNFYREPTIVAKKLHLDETALETYFLPLSPTHKWKVTLPSPFLFAKLTHDTASNTFEQTLEKITNLLVVVAAWLTKQGVSYIQLEEPYIPYHWATKQDLMLLKKSVTAIQEVKGAATLALQFYFGDAAPAITFLAEKGFPIDVLGIDFHKTSLSALPKKLPVNIIAGILDGRNSLLEDIPAGVRFITKAITYLQPEVLYLSSNSDLELLPEPVAKEKVKLLGKLKKLL